MSIPLVRFLFVGIFVFLPFSCIRAADSSRAPLLTIELRDGSRIVGTSLKKSVHFHSELLGELTFDLKDIRSVDCVSSNLTRVTTSNGDILNASLADSAVTVKTSFGKVELPVDSIRTMTVSTMVPGLNSGLVGFWSGNNRGKDSVSGTDADLRDITFEDGMNGQAFSFNGVSSSIRVPASPALDVGADDGFTVMAWIKPSSVEGIHPLFAWLINGTLDDNTPHIFIGLRPDENGVLHAAIPGIGGNPSVVSHEGVLVPGVFQHIAFTYDKSSSVGTLFVNGVMVAQKRFSGPIVARTKGDLWISNRDERPGNTTTGRMFSGLMDDIAIFNRALLPSEIQTVCQEESHGQSLILPTPSTGWQELMND